MGYSQEKYNKTKEKLDELEMLFNIKSSFTHAGRLATSFYNTIDSSIPKEIKDAIQVKYEASRCKFNEAFDCFSLYTLGAIKDGGCINIVHNSYIANTINIILVRGVRGKNKEEIKIFYNKDNNSYEFSTLDESIKDYLIQIEQALISNKNLLDNYFKSTMFFYYMSKINKKIQP